MYEYIWDDQTGGILLTTNQSKFSKEPRPVYSRELDILGFDQHWNYPHDDSAPIMWAEANNYIYRGKLVAQTKGGNLTSVPQIIIVDKPEPDNGTLRPVDINMMVAKNMELIEQKANETKKTIENIYTEYQNKVDVFYVAFSGGKDSIVTLDLVQSTLSSNMFKVLFGDTGMEFSDTYQTIDIAKKRCEELGIRFYTARANINPHDSWKRFGPPSSSIRWCCSVHKTTPQLLLLRDILGKNSFTEMAFVGVRRDESVRRSGYDYISYGTKHKGQYSCNPILEWNSAEVYLYLFANGLPINMAYKKGISRAGCLLCPMAAQKNDFMNHACYADDVNSFIDIIKEVNCSEKGNEQRMRSYLENTGWKARKNGRDLSISPRDYSETQSGNNLIITFKNRDNIWKQWIKTLGRIIATSDKDVYRIENGQEVSSVIVKDINDGYCQVVVSSELTKNNIDFLRKIRRVFRKSHYCVSCRLCEANCKLGNLQFNINGKLTISDSCTHCGQCLEIDTGCLVYKSLWLSRVNGNMNKKSLDCYATHAPKMEWFTQFVKLGERFEIENGLGNNEVPAFKRFLREAGIIDNNSDTKLGSLLRENGLDNEITWALMLTNLCYSPQVGWFVQRFPFNENISQKRISTILADEEGVSKSAEKSIPNSIKRIANLPLNEIGFGIIVDSNKNDGFIMQRKEWQNPDPRVVLFCLYKFAEACGNYYQFTLSRLMDNNVESTGVSPAQIYGLDVETMIAILKGLSINYPEFISTSFTHDLDNISLKEDKKAEDILNLF